MVVAGRAVGTSPEVQPSLEIYTSLVPAPRSSLLAPTPAPYLASRGLTAPKPQTPPPYSKTSTPPALHNHLLHAPPLTLCPQVASTGDIQVGSWVRIYALDRYNGPARRGRLLQNVPFGAGLAPGGRNGVDGSVDGPISSNLALPAPLPLTSGLRRAVAQARLDLAVEEAEEQQGVSAAAAPGSLDAYLYGEQAGAPSGQSEPGFGGGEPARLCCMRAALHGAARSTRLLAPAGFGGVLGRSKALPTAAKPRFPGPPLCATQADMYDKADHIRFTSR